MPLHLMQYILKYNSYYNKIKNLDKPMIINHFIKIIDNGVGKINIKLNSENIKNNIQNHDFMEIFDYIYSSVCNNKRLFYKENHVYDFIPAIIKKYPNAKFIIQVRDPRDFALSMVKRSYEIHDIFRAISVWNRDQKNALKLINSLPGSCYVIKYEDLINNTKENLINICSFLDVDFDSNMLNFFDNPKIKNASSPDQFMEQHQ